MGNKEYCHAKEFQKGLFRALCLGALGLLVWGVIIREALKKQESGNVKK